MTLQRQPVFDTSRASILSRHSAARARELSMMRSVLPLLVLLAVLASSSTAWGQVVAGGLDADTIQAGLRTAEPTEVAYIRYAVALVEHGQLPRAMVEGMFQWARRKAPYPKKVQYFKHGLILRAREIGVRLPTGLVDETPAIRGQLVVRFLGRETPVPAANVRIEELDRDVTTDAHGRFAFDNVPYGRYTLTAQGVALFIPRRTTVGVTLPTTGSNSDGSAFVRIVFR
jgi:hypothetical protein